MVGAVGWSSAGFKLAGLVTLILTTFGCSPIGKRESSLERRFGIADSMRLELGFDFLRRNSGSFLEGGRTYFFFADLETAKRLSVFDDSLRKLKEVELGWLIDDHGELAGIGLVDTTTYWILTKYTNTLLRCANDSIIKALDLQHAELPWKWADELNRSRLMTTSSGLSISEKGDPVLRVDWEVPPSCAAEEVDCCYFDSIRYRPLAVHMRTDETGGMTLTYALDSFFHRTVPGHEVNYLAAGLGFSRWGNRFAAFTSWSDRVMIGELDDPFSTRTVQVRCANSKSKADPVPCMNVGNGNVLNERLRSEGHVVQIDWDRGKRLFYLVVLHDRPIEGSTDWDFSIIQYDSSWVKVEETTFIDSAYDPGRCYLHPQGFLMGRLTERGAKRGLLLFDLVEL